MTSDRESESDSDYGSRDSERRHGHGYRGSVTVGVTVDSDRFAAARLVAGRNSDLTAAIALATAVQAALGLERHHVHVIRHPAERPDEAEPVWIYSYRADRDDRDPKVLPGNWWPLPEAVGEWLAAQEYRWETWRHDSRTGPGVDGRAPATLDESQWLRFELDPWPIVWTRLESGGPAEALGYAFPVESDPDARAPDARA